MRITVELSLYPLTENYVTPNADRMAGRPISFSVGLPGKFPAISAPYCINYIASLVVFKIAKMLLLH
jgi:hypothetical protein